MLLTVNCSPFLDLVDYVGLFRITPSGLLIFPSFPAFESDLSELQCKAESPKNLLLLFIHSTKILWL